MLSESFYKEKEINQALDYAIVLATSRKKVLVGQEIQYLTVIFRAIGCVKRNGIIGA